MNWKHASSLASIGAILTVACYSTYTGIYSIRKADHVESVDFTDLGAQIREATADLGFVRQPGISRNLVLLLKRRVAPPSGASDLDGSDARMTIAVDLENLSITLRDLSNPRETDFSRTVRRRIEERLGTHYGVSNISFERQIDMPFPN